MKLDFIDIGHIDDSAVNMRHGRKAPDVADILPTVRKRGIIVPVILRPGGIEGRFELVAGRRRVHAVRLAQADEGADPELGRVPSAIMEAGDDAAALEASLIENIARLDPDEVTRWETFARLVKQGREPAEIAETFGLPDLAVKRILALGNLMPRIRDLYRREEIDRATVRILTMASKSQQRDWLALHDDPEAHCPNSYGLKAWLLGGQTIAVKRALFDTEGMAIVSDLFGEDGYFADADAFWQRQDAAIEAKRAAFLEEGWPEVVVLPRGEVFQYWEHEKTAKRKGGRVYVAVSENGEVTFHEGYLSRKDARRREKGEPLSSGEKPKRPEVTSTLGTYIDLHRHAAVRAALLDHPQVALRLMVAHAIVGSELWTVKPEPQTTRTTEVRTSVEGSLGAGNFAAERREVLALLGQSSEDPTVARGGYNDPYVLACVFQRLMSLDDGQVMRILAVVMGETLASGCPSVDAVAAEIGVDMSGYWQADEAFFGLLRDREVLLCLVAEVAGKLVVAANIKEPSKTLKAILRDHLAGEGGRAKVEGWVPRWLAFPPAAYTARGGVGSVTAHAKAMAAREDVAAEAQAPMLPARGAGEEGERDNPEKLAV